MRFTSKIVVRLAAFGVAAASIGVPLAVATGAQATTPATMTSTTTTSLTDGEMITVVGANFATTTALTLVECSGNTVAACDSNALDEVPVVTGVDGSFTTSFTVHEGTIGNGVCGLATPSAALPSNTQCFIAAKADPTAAATAGTLKFYFNPIITLSHSTGLKGGQHITVSGAGFPQTSTTVYIVECTGTVISDCGLSTLKTSATTASGTFPATAFTVTYGSLGNNLSNKPAGSCTSSSKGCLVAATTDTSGAPANRAGALIKLAVIPKLKTTVTAKASAKKVPSTKKFTISGAVKAGGKAATGIKATLYSVTGKKLHKLASLKVTHGKYKSGKIKGPKKSAKYEVKILKQTVKGTIYLASASKVITVKK
jgi:hypothetical protein